MGVTVKPIVIVGAGGHGREMHHLIEAINTARPTWKVLGFVDDGDPPREPLERIGVRLLGPTDELGALGAAYVLGIGSGQARRTLAERFADHGLEAATLIHPTAEIGRDVEHDVGFVATAQVIVTTNVVIGRHVHINLAATVSHDCRVGDFVTINPGANITGSVILDDGVTIGTGASVIQGKRIGRGSIVGAGAVVVSDLDDQMTAVGVPARPIATASGRARASGSGP